VIPIDRLPDGWTVSAAIALAADGRARQRHWLSPRRRIMIA